MNKFSIYSFKSGINQSFDDSLIKPYEAYEAYNCDISRGTLKTKSVPLRIKSLSADELYLLAYYDNTNKYLLYAENGKISKEDGTSILSGSSSNKYDYLNFYKNDKNVIVFANGKDYIRYYDGTSIKPLKNRRPAYNDDGSLKGYYDADNNFKSTEAEITTYAPKGKFIELHYDRLWVGGVEGKEDLVYFSTSGQNGADIEDFTAPIEENEANMHGGYIDFSSYDGGKVIGIKVVGNDIFIFKERTMFKVFGYSPQNYTKVQIFSSNGAIANNSIVNGSNRCFFLNHNNIYQFDGVNILPIGDKVRNILSRMNKSYVENSYGIFFDDKYYLSIPIDNSTTNNCLIEFDTKTNSFMVYNLECYSLIEFNKELLYSNKTGIYNLNKPTDKILPLIWESSFIEFDKNVKKNFDYFYGVCNGSCEITLTTEKKDKSVVFEETRMKKKLKNKGRKFKIKIKSINDSTPFELSTPEWFYEADED